MCIIRDVCVASTGTPRPGRTAHQIKRQKRVHHKQPPPRHQPIHQRDEQADDVIQCTHYELCSGCNVRREAEVAVPPAAVKAASFFASQQLGIPHFPVALGEVHGWRRRARLAVRNDATGQPCVGLYLSHSHDILDIPLCR